MNYLNLETNTLTSSPEFVLAGAAERGAWISLLLKSVALENNGVLEGVGLWKERDWLKFCGLTFADLSCDDAGNPSAKTTLWYWVNHDLHVWGFPHDKLAQVNAGREGGKKGGRPRKFGSPPPAEPSQKPPGFAEGKPSPKPERNGMEGKENGNGKEVPPSIPLTGEAEKQDAPCSTPPAADVTRSAQHPAGDIGGKATEPPASPPDSETKKKKGGRGGAADLGFPPEFPEALQPAMLEWLAYKREKGQGYKPLGWAKLLKEVSGRGADELQAAVDFTMSKNWQGLVFREESPVRQGPGMFGRGPEKKVTAAAPRGPSDEPEWDWLELHFVMFGTRPTVRWQHLPASTRFELRQEHEKKMKGGAGND